MATSTKKTDTKEDSKENVSEETAPVYNINDGLYGRDGGPYLDQELQRQQEILNARREGREPDFDNLPIPAGIVAVGAKTLVQSHVSTRLAGQENLEGTEFTAPVLAEVPVVKDEGADERAKAEQDAIANNVNPSQAETLSGDDLAFAGDGTPATKE